MNIPEMYYNRRAKLITKETARIIAKWKKAYPQNRELTGAVVSLAEDYAIANLKRKGLIE